MTTETGRALPQGCGFNAIAPWAIPLARLRSICYDTIDIEYPPGRNFP